MGVSLELWRCRIGCFSMPKPRDAAARKAYNISLSGLSLALRVFLFLLLAAQCIELNPGPPKDKSARGGKFSNKHRSKSRGAGSVAENTADVPIRQFVENPPDTYELQSQSILQSQNTSLSKQQTLGSWLSSTERRMTRSQIDAIANPSRSPSIDSTEIDTDDERPSGDEETEENRQSEHEETSARSNVQMSVLLDIQKSIKALDKKFDKKLENIERSVKSISKENKHLKEQNKQLQDKVGSLQTQVQELTHKCNNIENQSRRQNLKFFNINEGPKETWEQTENKVRDYIKDELNMDESGIRIERAHRLPGRMKPRPVIVKFSFFKDRDVILKTYRQKVKADRERGIHGGETNTRIRISEDFPEHVRRTRDLLRPFLKEAIENGNQSFFRFDKLVIDNKTYVWNPETERPEPLQNGFARNDRKD